MQHAEESLVFDPERSKYKPSAWKHKFTPTGTSNWWSVVNSESAKRSTSFTNITQKPCSTSACGYWTIWERLRMLYRRLSWMHSRISTSSGSSRRLGRGW